LAVVTFHSLEDRVVKSFLKNRGGKSSSVSRYLPQLKQNPAEFVVSDARGIAPGPEEIEHNPRARSARLRWAELKMSAESFSGGER
jgi:16S rRNA (cytosine1402-N4)-methyltransferase